MNTETIFKEDVVKVKKNIYKIDLSDKMICNKILGVNINNIKYVEIEFFEKYSLKDKTLDIKEYLIQDKSMIIDFNQDKTLKEEFKRVKEKFFFINIYYKKPTINNHFRKKKIKALFKQTKPLTYHIQN